MFDGKALWNLSYGMYIVGAKHENIVNAQVANTVIQVSNNPPSIAVSISKNCYTHDLIDKSGAFSVSVLEQETPMEFIGIFGFRCGRDFNKFEKVKYETGVAGSPIVKEHALAVIEAKLTGKQDSGTHTIFVGDVVAGEIIKQGEPLTYAYYQNVKKGKAHKNAPTYKGEAVMSQKGENKMQKYVCKVCGYVYDPSLGDPENGVNPGTKFEGVPDAWVCPVCGVGKDQFEVKS